MTAQGEPAPFTALFLVLPEIEEFARPYRRRYTTDGAAGLPAHITLLYPFEPGAQENDEISRRVREVAATIKPFALDLSRLERFSDHRILFLSPAPHDPIIAVIRTLMAAFPGVQLYGGEVSIEEFRPHSTLAICSSDEEMAALEADIGQKMASGAPLATTVDRIHLAAKIDGQWQILEEYPLGGV